MGAKGLQTRRRLLQATETMLRTTPVRDLRVAEIAKAANTSTSTFYLYFQDVSEAVLAVANGVSQSTPEFMAQLDSAWEPERAFMRAQTLVESYVDHWTAHAAVFRVRNLAADEGDERFIAVREHAVRPIMRLMEERIRERQALGALPADLHAPSAAGVLMAMLERMGALLGQADGLPDETRRGLTPAAAFVTAVLIGGSASVGDIHELANDD
jgi:AcrR family transcriptional regulator